jgi:hypothetical protein
VLIKDVPAEVCGTCGEYDLDDEVARKVYGQAEDAADRHTEVRILGDAA